MLAGDEGGEDNQDQCDAIVAQLEQTNLGEDAQRGQVC